MHTSFQSFVYNQDYLLAPTSDKPEQISSTRCSLTSDFSVVWLLWKNSYAQGVHLTIELWWIIAKHVRHIYIYLVINHEKLTDYSVSAHGALGLLLWLNPKPVGIAHFLIWQGSKFYGRRGVFLNVEEEWSVNSIYIMLNLGWRLLLIRQLVYKGMWSLLMVLVGHGSNNRLRVWERVKWTVCYSNHKHLHERLKFSETGEIRNQWLWMLFTLPTLWWSRN